MSRLDELIQELCPAGVELRKIKEVYTRLKGTPITAGKMKEIDNPNGDIKVFAGGKTVIKAFEEDIPRANIIRVPAVLVQSRGVIDAVYYEEPFTFKNEMWAYTADEKTSVKYLYYVLKNNIQQFRVAASGMGSMPQISLKVTEEFIIPVPPLPVQSEIVRILDNFTELTARKQQYEYYRKQALCFDGNTPMERLGDTCLMKSGKAIKATFISETQSKTNQYKCYGGNGVRGFVSELSHQGEYPIIGRQGALCGNINYAVGDFYATEHAVVVKSLGKYIPRFLFYLLTAMNLNQYKSQGAQPGLAVGNIENLLAPVPSIKKQEYIVNLLDRFDTLCNDISTGLPAEIEARQKQYEYYRDKLLTFKEINSDEN